MAYKRLLNALKKDERQAPKEYKRLLHKVKSLESKRMIKGIIKDEQRHQRILRRL